MTRRKTVPQDSAARQCALPAVVRPESLICRECGKFLENAVEFSTCPDNHGKLRPFLDRPTLRLIRDIKLAERATELLNAAPVAVVACSRPRRFKIDGHGESFVVQSKPKTVDQLFRLFRRGRLLAKLPTSATGWAAFKFKPISEAASK